jgi:cob(I)alamin adenosyltransferase
VTRRAERSAAAAAAQVALNPQALAYINRLSDHLFVMARRVNSNGATDIKWVPGASR